MPLPPDSSDPVVDCFDRWSRRVIAREHRWDSHIVAEHPEMLDDYGEVEATIRNPEFVNFDATRPQTDVFYRTIEPPHPYAGYYCKVVVRYGPGNVAGTITDGEVVTAFVTNKVRKGEQHKWP